MRTGILILIATALRAQSLEVYSEFQRVDPSGKVVAIDRAEQPREILSPAVARNGYASFHIVVSAPPKTNYLLYVVTNPLDACRVTLYKERFVKTGGGWVPDTLEEIHRLPDFGAMPDPDEDIPGQNTRVYLLDIWIPPDADPGVGLPPAPRPTLRSTVQARLSLRPLLSPRPTHSVQCAPLQISITLASDRSGSRRMAPRAAPQEGSRPPGSQGRD